MKVTQDMTWVSLSIDSLNQRLITHERNSRRVIRNTKKIKKSIVEFGYVDPIIVNFDGTLIGGHQRLTSYLT